MRRFKNLEEYDGSPVCPRCGSRWPVCADTPLYDHAYTCERYQWADDVCEPCEAEMVKS